MQYLFINIQLNKPSLSLSFNNIIIWQTTNIGFKVCKIPLNRVHIRHSHNFKLYQYKLHYTTPNIVNYFNKKSMFSNCDFKSLLRILHYSKEKNYIRLFIIYEEQEWVICYEFFVEERTSRTETKQCSRCSSFTSFLVNLNERLMSRTIIKILYSVNIALYCCFFGN